jgi:multicomponent Na+:H+ antiporter subunit E
MTRLFLLNLMLAATYLALTGDFSGFNVLIGFLIGYGVLTIYDMASGGTGYSGKLLRLVRFGFWFMWILFLANLQIAWEIITPGMHQTPRIIRYPVAHLTDVQITTLANCITLTPGTLVVDVADDRQFIYVHCMYAKDRDKAVADLDMLRLRLEREVFAT